MYRDSLIFNPLGIPPIQIGREPLQYPELFVRHVSMFLSADERRGV